MKKIITTSIAVALLTTIGMAQQTPSKQTAEKQTAEKQTAVVSAFAKVMRDQPFAGEKVIKNKPYSLEAVSESVQVLADGNRITRKTSVKMFRDGEGRTRREGNGVADNFNTSQTSGFSFAFSFGVADSVSIYDPVNSVRFSLDPKTKTARRYNSQNLFGAANFFANGPDTPARVETKNLSELSAEQRTEIEKKIAQYKKNSDEMEKKFAKIDNEFSNVLILGSLGSLSYNNAKPESLGTKTIEGVEAVGTRTVKTIEAGVVGNELPIEITYEKWYSEDLDLIVYSRKYDPRSGEQIYRLININQTEPDNSLFTIPADYKIVESKSVEFKNFTQSDNLFKN